jgi:hypothetical protein
VGWWEVFYSEVLENKQGKGKGNVGRLHGCWLKRAREKHRALVLKFNIIDTIHESLTP